MEHDITGYVGLDVHKDSIAVAVAAAGRAAPRFVGTTGPRLAELTKALSHLGTPAQLHLAYEAGPCGYTLARQLIARGYRCEVIAVVIKWYEYFSQVKNYSGIILLIHNDLTYFPFLGKGI